MNWFGRFSCSALLMLVCGASPAAVRAGEEITAEELAAVKAAEAARIAAIDKVYGSVVSIYGEDRQGGGSGVVFDMAGYVLTNFHVVSAAGEEGWAGLADGNLYRWKLLGFDPGGDLAIIKLSGKDHFPAAEIGDSSTVRVGDWAMAMGNPFTLAEDQKPTVTLGVVSAVERYQPGAGKNALVYGNCIQVDSSINPGNSGGPLFNLRGQVIGINGRASFEERGRVNVGVGYAISAEQAKNFLPDLLASKLCMHGTLDAVFTERDGQPICSKLNLDSPIARQGLQLGDRLLEFNGQPIHTANQFTNLISTLPAGWPVEVVYEQKGQRKSARVRLEGLPYEQRQEARAQAEPDGQPDMPGDDPAAAPSKVRSRAKPGEIRDLELNAQEARRLIKQLAKSLERRGLSLTGIRGGSASVTLQASSVGPVIERRRWIWSTNGRFREGFFDVDTETPTGVVYGFDGAEYYRQEASGKVSTRAGSDFELQRREHAVLATFAALYSADPASAFSELSLVGGDSAAGQRAFLLRGVLPGGRPVYLWLSTTITAGEPAPELLKLAPETTAGSPDSHAWLVSELRVPNSSADQSLFRLVEGLAEAPTAQLTIRSLQLLHDDLPEQSFAKPTGGDHED